MIKSKRYYAQRIILGLQDEYPNEDFKIDEREVFPVIDDIVNRMAETDYFDNWKFSGQHVDEQFITQWDEITVVDQDDEQPSYFNFPSNYAALPNNRGIDEIWPLNYRQKGDDHSVAIMTHQDFRRFKSLQAGKLEGRLGGYPQGARFYFTTCGVKKKFGNVGLRLVIRSSADIAIDAPYPIPANREGDVVLMAIQWFMNKRDQPTDEVRDGKDKAP
jgi:hypothetical protein